MYQFELSLHTLSEYQAISYVIASLFGLMIGSFLNVVIFRLPKAVGAVDESRHWPIIGGRSKCTSCSASIRWYENMPVFSFLYLRGRCSSCQSLIPIRYPLIELLVALLAVMMLWKFYITWQAIGWFVFCCLLLTLALIDLDHFILPDVLTLPTIWIGLFLNSFGVFVPSRDAVLGAVFGWGILALINLIYKLFSGRDGIGRGDWKLAAGIGAWLGYTNLFASIFIAFFVGAIVGILLIIAYGENRRAAVPFGPFLVFGGISAVFLGPALVGLYLDWLVNKP